MSPPLRLTGTRIAEFFRFGCERQLRYELVPAALRGEGIPRPNTDPAQGPIVGPRAGAALLSAAGRAWERRKLRQLLRRVGEERALVAGWTPGGNPRRLPVERVIEALRAPGALQVLVQPELRLSDPHAFLRRYGLEESGVELAPAVPDLIRIRRLSNGRLRFQVVDIKASSSGHLAHYAQVAFYTLLLEELCRAERIGSGRVDTRWGRIWSRAAGGPKRFALAAYRHHVERLLHRELPRIARQAPEQAEWHVGSRCGGCLYLNHCRSQADEQDDLARVVGITPLAKTVLRDRGIRTVKQLASSLRKDTYQGCHALESQAERLRQRAQAVRFGKIFDVDTRSHAMPPEEDVRVVLSAEGDPVSGRCFALGARVDTARALEGTPLARAWVADGATEAAERAMLEGLLTELDHLLARVDAAGRAFAGRGGGLSLHFYVYDRTELELLRQLLLRHLPEGEARPLIARLLRFLSPRAVAAQPSVARTSPGTVVSEVVATLFALPVPYAYDLASISARLQPASGPQVYRPRVDYATPFSSQVAFERIHNVWRGRPHATAAGEQSPDEVREEVRGTVEAKLAAIDSVVRAVQERAARRQRLQLRKEPFALTAPEPPLPQPALETLRLFAEMESAAEAIGVRALHVLPATERARRFECIRGMHLVERRADGALVFEFDPECRDAKFRVGEFNLLLTNDDDRSLLDLERQPWKRRRLTVELVEYDLSGPVPRVVLAPGSGFAKAEEQGWIHLDRVCALDRAASDFNTSRILATLRALADGHGQAEAVLQLLQGRVPAGWAPPLRAADEVFRSVLGQAAERYGRPVLNPDQERAWREAFARCASVIWGPPGTGKTYLLAWILIGLAAAARLEGRPLRVLVAAATHRAIVNVLAKLADELRGSGVEVPMRAVKLRGSGSEADSDLADTLVEVVPDTRLPALLREVESGGDPLIVGSTVWSLWKQMRARSANAPLRQPAEDDEADGDAPVQPWFDVVIVDEASQMKVAEALIAMSSMRPGAQVILCGDDRQLAPVVRGSYDAELGSLFGSVFGHMASLFPRLGLRESRRMNRVLVEYPRETYYPGLVSMVPERRIRCGETESGDPLDALCGELFLHPDDAVVLCTYRGLRATARNPFEAQLAARIARVAREVLHDPTTGERYGAEGFVEEALAILSPHRAQNSAISAELQRLGLRPGELPVVDTVERMQGNEREMIVVSYGVADREYAEAEAGFLLDPNRFNVAITRARAKLVVLVSEEVLDALPTDDAVLAGSMALKGYRAHCADGVREVTLHTPDGAPVAVRCHYRRLASGRAEAPSTHGRAAVTMPPL